MSLKIFHIIFIIVSTLLSFGFAAWAFSYCLKMQAYFYCTLGIASIIFGIVMIVYGNKFFKKLTQLAVILSPFICFSKVYACAVCYGAKDSALTKGLTVGIITLLIILSAVLTCVVVFLLGVRKRSKLLAS
ncbi:MAG TPA: hypothetical protein VJA17_02780 [Candidatus Omnitrophota bacterium]|nr:hypothetical protein [Candidatus Omnitrophota bacterium]